MLIKAGDEFNFIHDRIRETAYQMIAAEQRPEIHYAIGKALLAGVPGIAAEPLFDIASQLNAAILLLDHEERTIYILNSTLLLLHEIESAYEKEWELLKLPGKISGFLIMHIPIILIIFYGLIELANFSKIGLIVSFLLGIGGVIPFLVHKIFVKRNGHFEALISNVIIYSNALIGIVLAILSIGYFS